MIKLENFKEFEVIQDNAIQGGWYDSTSDGGEWYADPFEQDWDTYVDGFYEGKD